MILLFFYILNPFFSFILTFFLINKGYGDRKNIKYVYIVISLFFAILSYTQKSTAAFEETDIVRYYDQYNECEYMTLLDPNLYYNLNIMYLGFDIISRTIVSITGNLQFFSFFWTFICYILYFLSCDNYFRYRGIFLSKNNFLWFIILSVTSFLLFTQITETYKQSVSCACFFYGFSCFLVNKKINSIIWILFSFFCHISSVLLLFMFVPLLLDNRYLNYILLFSIIIGSMDIMMLVGKLLSFIGGDAYFLYLLSGKAEKYGEALGGFSISMVFLLEFFILILSYFYIYLFTECVPKYKNLILPFICILFFNLSSPHNFDRCLNLGTFPLAVLFIDLLTLKPKYIILWRRLITIFIIVMLFVSLRKTYYRTISSTGYTSSYMDNSLRKILMSTSFDYWEYKYE